MDNEEYLQTQHMLTLIAGIVNDLDLVGFLNAINHSHTVGPILDPTLYHKAMGNLDAIEQMARAARSFQKDIQGVVQS